MASCKAIFPLSGRGVGRVVKKVYSKTLHARSLFASIATGMERTWYDFGTNLVRPGSLWGVKSS